MRTPDWHSSRSPRSQTANWHLQGPGGPTRQGRPFRFRLGSRAWGSKPGGSSASQNFALLEAGAHHPHRRWQGAASCRRGQRHARRCHRRCRGSDIEPQGRQSAGHRNPSFVDHQKGPGRPQGRARRGHGLGRCFLRAAARRCRRGQEADLGPRAGDVEAGKTRCHLAP